MSGTTAPLRAVPYDRYNGTIGAIFSRTTVGLLVYMHMEYANLPLGTANLLANLQNGGLAIMD